LSGSGGSKIKNHIHLIPDIGPQITVNPLFAGFNRWMRSRISSNNLFESQKAKDVQHLAGSISILSVSGSRSFTECK